MQQELLSQKQSFLIRGADVIRRVCSIQTKGGEAELQLPQLCQLLFSCLDQVSLAALASLV